MKRTTLVLFSLGALVMATDSIRSTKRIIGKSVAGKNQGARVPQAANPRIVRSHGKLPLLELNELGSPKT